MTGRTCIKCGRTLALSEFVTDSYATHGKKSICKACYRDIRKTYPSYERKRVQA